MGDYPVLKAGSHIAELVYCEKNTKKVPIWTNRQKTGEEETDMICFRYKCDAEDGRSALVFRDCRPYFKAEKGNLVKDLTALAGGTAPDIKSEDEGIAWLKERLGTKVLLTVKNYTKRNGDEAHSFVNIVPLPASMQPKVSETIEDVGENHPQPADTIDFDDIPF